MLAEVILVGGIERRESRGSHYRTDYTERDDVNFLKTTIAKYNADTGRPDIAFEDVNTSLVEPRARTYGRSDADSQEPTSPAGASVST